MLAATELGGGDGGGRERDTGHDQATPATLGRVELSRPLLGLFGGAA